MDSAWPAPVRKVRCSGEPCTLDELLSREWLVTNGLGGYASGTLAGIPTRRYHGYLIAALPSPSGRTVMLNHVSQCLVFPDGSAAKLCGAELTDSIDGVVPAEFRLEMRYAVWTYEVRDVVLERRVFMLYRQNTSYILYRLLSGPKGMKLHLAPMLHFRPHETSVGEPIRAPYLVTMPPEGIEIWDRSDLPALRLKALGAIPEFVVRPKLTEGIRYRVEERRGYDVYGVLWSPGYFQLALEANAPVTLVASTEPWSAAAALSPAEAYQTEWERRRGLIESSVPEAQQEIARELVLAADQFVFAPASRPEDAARALAAGEEIRSIIAGYHWFTDWGRDTMISLEGLTLLTGRLEVAHWILKTFSHYIRDGLVPNMFPEGGKEGLYHTADATLWFFHAIDRYLHYCEDEALLDQMIPILSDVVEHHIRGTRFGIRADPEDGLLTQGAAGYQLTWMDAKVDDWVVTPRRGKAVEINALWYNALRLLEGWLGQRRLEAAGEIGRMADRVFRSFNQRFWFEEGGYLYDVVDGEGGDDSSCRPNQVFALSLPHPVLEQRFWKPVLECVERELLTPVGLRSLSPRDANYKAKYDGDLRARDAAYHQGTVWGWLIGSFVDAWIRVHPGEAPRARRYLEGLARHLDEVCIGSMSEIFDAEPPYTPRGCIAQAWTVAEFLRAWVRTAETQAVAGENIP